MTIRIDPVPLHGAARAVRGVAPDIAAQSGRVACTVTPRHPAVAAAMTDFRTAWSVALRITAETARLAGGALDTAATTWAEQDDALVGSAVAGSAVAGSAVVARRGTA